MNPTSSTTSFIYRSTARTHIHTLITQAYTHTITHLHRCTCYVCTHTHPTHSQRNRHTLHRALTTTRNPAHTSHAYSLACLHTHAYIWAHAFGGITSHNTETNFGSFLGPICMCAQVILSGKNVLICVLCEFCLYIRINRKHMMRMCECV